MIKNMADIIREAENFAQSKIVAEHLDELEKERNKQVIQLIDYYILQGYTIVGDK